MASDEVPVMIFFGIAAAVVVGAGALLLIGGIIQGYRAGPNGLPPKTGAMARSGPTCANRDCNLAHPPEARYCRRCGQPLPQQRPAFDSWAA